VLLRRLGLSGCGCAVLALGLVVLGRAMGSLGVALLFVLPNIVGLTLCGWTWHLAAGDLDRMQRNEVDPHGRQPTTTALCTGVIGLALHTAVLLVCVARMF
jgi:hypothetical protein